MRRAPWLVVSFFAFVCVLGTHAAATCMGPNAPANLEERIAACTAEISNPYAFGWYKFNPTTGQKDTSGTPNGALGLLYNTRGATYRAKGDLTRAIADFEEAVRHDPRPNFTQNLERTRAELAARGAGSPTGGGTACQRFPNLC